ncbi:ribosomal protein L2 [Meira miltonrushii]|uniref:Large ribosomal subunit protein uL2m n=1 Tax=Meira miltonrushii TaxID=1280837 RepID=A0A316VFL1_9BASI|nr:ribosomal protein L2 [Meira miltonrushii]PWN34255.1 ribosomal protein L2 [Meira miltonrushii]
MRSILAGPSLLRQLPQAQNGSLHTSFSTCARLSNPKPTRISRASVSQVPSIGSTSLSSGQAAHLLKVGGKAQLMDEKADKLPQTPFRRERRKAEKEARKLAEKKKKLSKSIFAQAGIEEKRTSPFVRNEQQFKTFKPITHSLRWVRTSIQPHIYKGRPLRALTITKRSTGGRNHHGHVTVRGRGGGHRKRIRVVDFHRWESGPQKIIRIEYDPGRSAHIALVEHAETKIRSYILATDGLREGDNVQSYRLDEEAIKQATGAGGSALDMGMFRTRAIRPGNVLPLRLIPIGTMLHAISLEARGASKLVRSAGAYGQLVAFVHKRSDTTKQTAKTSAKGEAASSPAQSALPGSGKYFENFEESAQAAESENANNKEGGTTSVYAQVRLQSGEVRLLKSDCCATIGRVSNIDHEHERLGKAGRSRWLGRRPKVRGVAMNAVDHPHGGGRGKSKSNKHPRSIYGQKTKGPRTRKPGTKNGNRMVVKERPRGIEKRR